MKKITLAAAAAALFAMPAAANARAYVEVDGGLDSASIGGEASQGFAYGVAAGYDIELGNSMFAGIEATASDSTTKKCYGSMATIGYRYCVNSGRDLAAVVRLGTSVGEKTKLYVLGGYTNGRVRESEEMDTGNGIVGYKDGTNLDGFRLGAGLEQELGHNLFGKVEYRYSNYQYGVSRHQVVAGVGIKF
ncbi:outer membrane beta-barrel protein [Novosphingobium sp. BL-8A]|uniref:outer membrane protein n=1 Tax=Novosphingobium sp. BL-8A TaxID=3127639 RepID=UPI0037580006